MLLTNRLTANLDPWRVMRAIEESQAFQNLEDQWNQTWNQWFSGPAPFATSGGVRTWVADGRAVLEFDLPGLDPNAIEISVHRNLVQVKIPTTATPPVAEGEHVHLQERQPLVNREVRLPFEADPLQTVADYTNGVLRLTVQQPESHRPTRIAVKG